MKTANNSIGPTLNSFGTFQQWWLALNLLALSLCNERKWYAPINEGEGHNAKVRRSF
jgi:hypothetical protein